jgi:hypothetical protein
VKAKETGTPLGFVRCALGKRYDWWPPMSPCQFSPRAMNNDPISAKERRKARAMVRDISKQIQLYGEMASADEWWAFFFSCLYGQEVLDNPMRGELPTAPMFVLRNKRRTKDLNVSDGATFITLLYAFGNTREVKWSDPKWKAEMDFYSQQSRMAA